jgi:methyl-accepting chemotaxis protein
LIETNRTALTIDRLWRPYLWSTAIGIVFALIASYYFDQALTLTETENMYRQWVLWMVSAVILGIGAFVHVYLFRNAFLFVRSGDRGLFSRAFLQDLWVELVNYPARFCFYVSIVSIYTVVGVASTVIIVPFVLTSVPAAQYLYHVFIMTTILSIPLTVLLFLVLEGRIRRILAAYLLQIPAVIDYTDPRIITIGVRAKLLSVMTVAPLCALVLLIGPLERSIKAGATVWTLETAAVLLGVMSYILAAGFLMSRSILRPVRFINDSIRSMMRDPMIALDSLYREMPNSTDEIRELYLNFIRRSRLVQTMIERLRSTGDHITGHSEQIFKASTVQMEAVTVQASALSEISASTEELVHSVEQISDDLNRLNEGAQEAFQIVKAGSEKMRVMLQSIEKLHEEAQANSERSLDLSVRMTKIEDVIQIINYVTHHTKMLAFNAAIETQTAGDAGERFGVVAAEIRRFAQEIASSTDEIRHIISDIRKGIHTAVMATERELKLVSQTQGGCVEAQAAFDQIFQLVSDMAQAVEHISVSVEQQKIAHEQVWASIRNIDGVARDLLDKNRSILDPVQALNALSRDIAVTVKK